MLLKFSELSGILSAAHQYYKEMLEQFGEEGCKDEEEERKVRDELVEFICNGKEIIFEIKAIR